MDGIEVRVLVVTKNPHGTVRVLLQQMPERDIGSSQVNLDQGRWCPTYSYRIQPAKTVMLEEVQSDDGRRRIGNRIVNEYLAKPEPGTYMVKRMSSSPDVVVLAVDLPFDDVRLLRVPIGSSTYASFSRNDIVNGAFVAVSDDVAADFPWKDRNGMADVDMNAVFTLLDIPHGCTSVPVGASGEPDSFEFPEEMPPPPAPVIPPRLLSGGGVPFHAQPGNLALAKVQNP